VRSARLYTENEKKNKKLQFFYRLLTSTRNNIALYKSCEYCKHKTSFVRTTIYFREQYYAFGNQLGALVKKCYVFENFMCKYAVEIGVNSKTEQ